MCDSDAHTVASPLRLSTLIRYPIIIRHPLLLQLVVALGRFPPCLNLPLRRILPPMRMPPRSRTPTNHRIQMWPGTVITCRILPPMTVAPLLRTTISSMTKPRRSPTTSHPPRLPMSFHLRTIEAGRRETDSGFSSRCPAHQGRVSISANPH
jgi:hypothetical protein